MTESESDSVRDILLTRRGVAFVPAGVEKAPESFVRAIELELAEVGYVLKARLRDRLTSCSTLTLAGFRSWAIRALLAHIGGDQKHEPLFRRFPEGVPDNTEQLWLKKVLVHFLQADSQPCLFCGSSGTTHVLNPCRHVICDRCFDGANYSACPVCEHHVDRSSPFFQPDVLQSPPKENVRFKLIDLADDEEHETRLLFSSLCERTQALSPSDRQALTTIVRVFQTRVLEWLPANVPVRENVALIFGTLLQQLDASAVLPHARLFMTTATDVLRLIAVLSGTDGSLLSEQIFQKVERASPANRLWKRIAKLIGAVPPAVMRSTVYVPIRVFRFKVARLRRPLRRALLELLDGFPRDRLIEDMLRHRSYWVWVGEFLHPHEYARRFPNVALAFQVVRKKSEDGTPAAEFRGWYSRLERAFSDRDFARALTLLSARPGEFARRLDRILRITADDPQASESVIREFARIVSDLATPVLLTLRSHLRTRTVKAKVRVYWPKGRVATGASTVDERKVLPGWIVSKAVCVIEEELLRRFSEKSQFHDCLIDEQLRSITVPFNERTASDAAVTVPRGSRFPVELVKTVRIFLHWCEPQGHGNSTDLDLSVALYNTEWQFQGVCSYYQLKLATAGNETSRSTTTWRPCFACRRPTSGPLIAAPAASQ